MGIIVGNIAMTTDAILVRGTAPRLVARGTIAVELGVRTQKVSRLIAGAGAEYEQRKHRYHASGRYPGQAMFHRPAKYSTPIT
jgi:hypothetical protein